MHSSIRDKSEETEINEKNLFVFPQKNNFLVKSRYIVVCKGSKL